MSRVTGVVAAAILAPAGAAAYATQCAQDATAAVDALSDRVASGSPSADRGAAAIASSLDIDAYPTITVLEPDARMLLERGRINGYFDASALGRHFDTILWKTAPRRYVDERGVEEPRRGVWKPRAAPLGSQLNASLGATSRGPEARAAGTQLQVTGIAAKRSHARHVEQSPEACGADGREPNTRCRQHDERSDRSGSCAPSVRPKS